MKKIIIIICTIFLIAIGCLSFIYFTKSTYITSEEAKEIAMNDVSNKDNEYTFNSIEFKENDDSYTYTLVFSDKINLYTYKINAKTKKIISSKKELLNNNKKYISEDDILNLILKHANLNMTDCNILSNLVTLEDGMPFYNTIFYNNNVRYEYKTNAYTGSIVSVTKLNENAG